RIPGEMGGSKLCEAREVTYKLGDWRPLSNEGGEKQETIDIREEVGNKGAIRQALASRQALAR
ncbi:unnamed protein product, partial [Ilex paraguariensis]